MFVVFDHKSIIFIIIAMIIVLGAIAYFLRDCNCKTGPAGPMGPQGQSGQSFDMSNYVGNVNVTGDISASGKIKSGQCELNCTSPPPTIPPTPMPNESSSSSSGWIIGSVVFGIVLVVVGVLYFKYFSHYE